MAKEKKLTKEDVLNSIDSFSFEERVDLYNALESSIQAEASQRVDKGNAASAILNQINGKK